MTSVAATSKPFRVSKRPLTLVSHAPKRCSVPDGSVLSPSVRQGEIMGETVATQAGFAPARQSDQPAATEDPSLQHARYSRSGVFLGSLTTLGTSDLPQPL